MTLKQDAPGTFRLDMTVAKFKNARFFGPSVTSVSSMICPYLTVLVDLIKFDFDDKPYVFCQKGDPTRCLTSSAWSAYCKGVFLTWSGVACPPKVLRASFITYLRNATDCPEILASAARACRHKLETQASDRYDKESNDRLVASAVAFCEEHAKRYGGGASTSGEIPDNGEEWKLVPGQLPEYSFIRCGEGSDGKKPYACTLPWLDSFSPGMELRFPVLVGLSDGIRFKLPGNDAVVGRTLSIKASLDAGAVRKDTIKTTNMQFLVEVVERTREEVAASPTSIEAAKKRAEEGRAPVETHMLPPIAEEEVLRRMGDCGYTLASAAKNGDCWPLSVLASAGKILDALHPSSSTHTEVGLVRGRAVDLITGKRVEDVPSSEIRRQEGLPVTEKAAERKMAEWRVNGKWRTEEAEAGMATGFQFAVSVVVKQTAVLERCQAGFLNPCKVYAMRDGDRLVRSPASASKPETIPFWTKLPFDQIVSGADSFAIVAYDRDGMHYDPFVKSREDAEVAAITEAHTLPKKRAADELDVSVVEEQSLGRALSGPFTGLTVVDAPPPWMAAELESGKLKHLVGRHACHNWEEWGWHTSKISSSSARDSNASILHKDGWREEVCLRVEAYGTEGGAGAWVLLEGECSTAPPITEYRNGKYFCGGEWKRAALLVSHTDTQLSAARERPVSAEMEEAGPRFRSGASVYAMTSGTYFRARVESMVGCNVRVRFTATMEGETLFLPYPLVSTLPPSHIRTSLPPPLPPRRSGSKRRAP